MNKLNNYFKIDFIVIPLLYICIIKKKKNFNQNKKGNNNTQSVNIEIGVEKRRKNSACRSF